jgi:GntR family transcriptional regulator, carbon starvation induced regulator
MKIDGSIEFAASQQERACQQLRTDILEGELAPLSKLQIANLRERYETSVGPVREALSQLTAEGLVVKKGQRGHWVAPVSLDEFQEISRLRLMLEVDALRQSIRNGNLEWEANVVGAMHRLKSVQANAGRDPRDLARAEERENREFHKALISRCPSNWQLRFVDMLYDHSARYRMLCIVTDANKLDLQQKDHLKIMQAALAREMDQACDALTVHIESASRSVVTAIFGKQS